MANILIEKTRINQWGFAGAYTRYRGRKYYLTSLKIPAAHWDQKNQVVKAGAFGAEEVNQAILQIKRRMAAWEYDDYTHEEMKEMIRKMNLGYDPKDLRDDRDLVKTMKEYLKSRPEIAPGTKKTYLNAIRVFIQFKPDLTWRDLGDVEIYRHFMSYILEEKERANGYWNVLCEKMKAFGIWLYKKNGAALDPESFKGLYMAHMPAQGTWLTEEELELLKKVKIKDLGEKKVWTDFIFRCLTGLRISETPQINKTLVYKNGNGHHAMNIVLIKQTRASKIPLHPEAYQILVDNNFRIPMLYNTVESSKSQYNLTIKRLCQRAGITQPYSISRSTGKKYRTERGAKWNYIASHTARRTFARHAYNRGVSILMIQQYLQHSSIDTTMRYIGVERKEVFQAFENSWKF